MIDNNEVAYGGGEDAIYDEEGHLIEYYAVRPNKTQIKREIAEVARLADSLTELAVDQLNSLQMPNKISAAIAEAKKMPATRPARRRQLKFITAQLRQIELDPIIEAINRIKSQSAHGIRSHHQAEKWRDRLIDCQDNQVLTQLLKQFPHANSQQLRQLQRNARKERQADKPVKSARLLYQYLKQLLAS